MCPTAVLWRLRRGGRRAAVGAPLTQRAQPPRLPYCHDATDVLGREELRRDDILNRAQPSPTTSNTRYQGRISTYPSVPCTRIRCPSWMSWVAFSTPTTAGKPYSRAITAPWVIRPPTSVTRPLMATNRGVQLGSV